MRVSSVAALVLGALLVAAAGCKKSTDGELPPPPGFGEKDHIIESDRVDYSEYDDANPDVSEDEDESGAQAKGGGEPVFKEGMTVEQAIDAAAHTERLNIDQEALGAPLTRQELYEPCKLTPNDHFDLRVAVWNGRAVGIDLDTKNEKLKACLVEQIKKLHWPDKVKSLNTVEYSM